MAIDPIRIEGLREFKRDLAKLGKEHPKAMRLAANSAAELVVSAARPRVPRRSGRAAGSIKAASTATAARVQEGGSRAPYMPWLDFGGKVGPQRSVKRPFLKQGRYVWKAYADNDAKVADMLETELTKVARAAGLEIT